LGEDIERVGAGGGPRSAESRVEQTAAASKATATAHVPACGVCLVTPPQSTHTVGLPPWIHFLKHPLCGWGRLSHKLLKRLARTKSSETGSKHHPSPPTLPTGPGPALTRVQWPQVGHQVPHQLHWGAAVGPTPALEGGGRLGGRGVGDGLQG